ncbi:MAG: hypothetical protein WC375_10555 [Methanomassiliicoccales archaeon]|jgi:hypothetical protein
MKIKLSKSQWTKIGQDAGWKVPQSSHCFNIIEEIKPVFQEVADLHYLADGIRAVFLYKDGQKYEVVIKPYRDKVSGEAHNEKGN